MKKNYTFHKRKVWIVFFLCLLMILCLIGRLIYLMGFRSDYYYEKAEDLHERERDIKAARGEIVDAKGKVLAANKTVCTISVIHSQIKEPEKVIALLTEKLGISEQTVRKKVEKISSIERIRTNVEKETGDEIRNAGFAGIKVDEDYRRYYPMGTLASKVLGFTGGDNQGIIGLEVQYEDYLKGINGQILTITDARGIELDEEAEGRKEPVKGDTLKISLDANLQKYAEQMAEILCRGGKQEQFNEGCFQKTVEKIMVFKNGTMDVHMRNGVIIQIKENGEEGSSDAGKCKKEHICHTGKASL